MFSEGEIENHDLNGEIAARKSDKQMATFAELLEEYEPASLRQGQYVHGEILQIDHNIILADVDAKRTAVVPRQDLAAIEDDELAQISVGDEVTFYVLRTPKGNEDLLVSLHKGLEHQDWLVAESYLADEEQLELEVTGYNKGGLLVAFGHLRGFVPSSHVPQLQNVREPYVLQTRKAELVGQELLLKVIEVDSKRRRLVLSAKKAQKEQRLQRLRELKLQVGATITGCITNLVGFGAFVDLGGIEGLIHVSEIAWEKVEDPAEYLTLGEDVEVEIMSVDVDRERVSLSRKELLPSSWELFEQRHSIGDLVEGVITSVADFGAFALVDNDIEGLIHISEMHGAQDFAPQDLLSSGDEVLLHILNIQTDRHRLALSQRRVSNDEEIEWMQRRRLSDQIAFNDEEE